jgi:hypothetical protein
MTSIHQLAAANQSLNDAIGKYEEAGAAHAVLTQRRAQRQLDADAALESFRRGELEESTASLRREAAALDVKDIDVLLAQSSHVVASLQQAVSVAQSAVAQARQQVEHETRQLEYVELQKHVAAAEENYLASVAALHARWLALNPNSKAKSSTWGCHSPSAETRALVGSNEVPRLRA